MRLLTPPDKVLQGEGPLTELPMSSRRLPPGEAGGCFLGPRSCRSCTQIQRLVPDKVQTPDPHGAGTSLFGPNSRHIQASPLSSLSVPGLRRGLLCPIVRCVRPFSGQGDPHEAGQSTRGASWVMPSFMATSPNGRGCYRIHQCRRGAKQGYDGYEVCQPCNMHVET